MNKNKDLSKEPYKGHGIMNVEKKVPSRNFRN